MRDKWRMDAGKVVKKKKNEVQRRVSNGVATGGGGRVGICPPPHKKFQQGKGGHRGTDKFF